MGTILQKSLKGEWFVVYPAGVHFATVSNKFRTDYSYPPRGYVKLADGRWTAGPLKKSDEPENAI